MAGMLRRTGRTRLVHIGDLNDDADGVASSGCQLLGRIAHECLERQRSSGLGDAGAIGVVSHAR
jgi:hypothetical protein